MRGINVKLTLFREFLKFKKVKTPAFINCFTVNTSLQSDVVLSIFIVLRAINSNILLLWKKLSNRCLKTEIKVAHDTSTPKKEIFISLFLFIPS
jgi:hypothetical protein